MASSTHTQKVLLRKTLTSFLKNQYFMQKIREETQQDLAFFA